MKTKAKVKEEKISYWSHQEKIGKSAFPIQSNECLQQAGRVTKMSQCIAQVVSLNMTVIALG